MIKFLKWILLITILCVCNIVADELLNDKLDIIFYGQMSGIIYVIFVKWVMQD